MRQLPGVLLGLVPIACTVSSAAPSGDPPARPAIATSKQAPIIERGQGCPQDIAADADASVARRRGGEGGGRRMPGAKGRAEPADAPAEPVGGAALADRAAAPPPPSPTATAPATPPASRPRPAPPRRAPARTEDSKIASDRVAAPQPSGVRAGEWDDNANYRDYVKWLAASPIRGKLDIGARQFVVVADRDGKPVPNCSLTISDGSTRASLVTMASGRAVVFPRALGFGNSELVATASCSGATATARLGVKEVDGVVKLSLDRSRALPARRMVDLAFVLDTTGSMQEEIDAVKHTVRAIADQLSTAQTDVRIGLVEYKDRSDCLLTRTFPFSSDLAAFSRSVDDIVADGGGDTPEDMHAGLSAALDKLQWRGDAVTRMVVVIADAPPQFYQDQRHYDDVARRAAGRGIKLFTVSASGMDDQGQVAMRQLAQFTGASNLFVLRGGAGPQSVGGGDPRSSCGGSHGDYATGKLDLLILRKLRQELASLDADPMLIPGRGQDENAKPCEQRLVVAN